MGKLLPNVFDYLKTHHRTVKSNNLKELNYRISAYTDQEYDIAKEIAEVTFEEFINAMAEGKELLFSFGNIGIDKKSLKFYCTVHNKFRKFYGKSRFKNKF